MKVSAKHPLYGPGQVRSWRRGGRAALVEFEGEALPIEVPVAELELSTAIGTNRSLQQGEKLSIPLERADAQRTTEAMRLGVVPAAKLDAYTVGREAEMSIVDADLEKSSQGGALRVFLGDYGVGKTHLLELIQHRALEQNYLVARVVLDPRESAPSHPKRVYRAATRSLLYPDRPAHNAAGLRPLLERAVEQLDAPSAAPSREEIVQGKRHLYLEPAVAYWRSLDSCSPARLPRGVHPEALDHWLEEQRALLLDWIEGHPTISNQDIDSALRRLPGKHPKIYSLRDFRPWSRIYGYLLSGISALARRVGYSGLVVLLDEAEFYSLLSPQNQSYARDLFRAWTYAAVGDQGLAFDANELATGGFGIQRELPPRFTDDPGLYLVYAMTPQAEGLNALRETTQLDAVVHLSPLSSADYVDLAQRVCEFYAASRDDWELSAAIVAPLAKVLRGLINAGFIANPRQAMKFIIEFLDVMRYYPQRIADLVRNLQENTLL